MEKSGFFLFLSENMIKAEKWQYYYFSDCRSDPKECRIIFEKHLQKLAEFVLVLMFVKGIDNEISDEFEHMERRSSSKVSWLVFASRTCLPVGW
jgi:hypothetical protein